ncbi:MAG: glutathione S-transferase N-terminal domain-containing protein [Gammaproteobacteria bacterium]
MKIIIRLFFKTVRAIVGPILLFGDWATTPKGVHRDSKTQQLFDTQTAELTLYQFSTCPFCIKVRRAIKRLSLDITICDARKNEQCREALLSGGGEIKVPCLRIVDSKNEVIWLYESDEIIAYLNERFSGEQLANSSV